MISLPGKQSNQPEGSPKPYKVLGNELQSYKRAEMAVFAVTVKYACKLPQQPQGFMSKYRLTTNAAATSHRSRNTTPFRMGGKGGKGGGMVIARPQCIFATGDKVSLPAEQTAPPFSPLEWTEQGNPEHV